MGQKTDSQNIVKGTYANYDELRKEQKDRNIEKLTYLDSTFNFRVEIPNWLKLMETGTIYVWGGKLPAVDSVENALVIKSFEKKRYKSLEDFEKYIVGDHVFGKPALWDSTHIAYGKKDLDDYSALGKAYRVSWFWHKRIYTCQYVLMETKTAYLWVDFTSTPNTYDKNLPKFQEFMSGFEKTNF